MLLNQPQGTRSFRFTFMLAGVALGAGLLVVLRDAQIPYFLYYPKSTNTILLSAFLDTYLFALATLSIPASLITLILQARQRRQPVDYAVTILLIAVAVWLPSFLLIWNYPFLSALGLYASTITMVAVNLLFCGRVYDLDRRRAVSDVLTPMMIIFALIEFASLYHWVFASFDPMTQIGQQAAELEANLTYAASPLAPLLFVGLLFSWLWLPPILRTLRVMKSGEIIRDSTPMPNRRTIMASIDLIAILAIVVTYYPYFAGQEWIVGVDSRINYYDPLVRLGSLTFSQGLSVLSSTFHGVYVGLLFLIVRATGVSPFLVVKFAPLLLALLTALIIFWILLKSTGSQPLATLSASCSILWIPTTMGIFTGIQTNWTALVLWMLFLALMLLPIKSQSKRTRILLLQAMASAGILAIHPWTWGVFLATLVIYAIIAHLARAQVARASLMSVFSAVILAVPAGIAGILLVTDIRNQTLDALHVYLASLNVPNFNLFIGDAFYQGLAQWASFLSPLILAICLLGSARVLQHKDALSRYLLAWIVVWSIGTILTAPIGYDPTRPAQSEPQLWRMLFLSPLPILLASGIKKALELSGRLETVTLTATRFRIQDSLTSILPTALCAALLVAFPSPIVKLVAVLAALAVCLLLALKQGPQATKTLIAMTLMLIVTNAAFRSLYPLLLDPHNLVGAWSGWKATG